MRGPAVYVRRTKMTDEFLLYLETDISKALVTEYEGSFFVLSYHGKTFVVEFS